jgi:hypothetical protein
LLLQTFDFDIVYRAGEQNTNADTLSRRTYNPPTVASLTTPSKTLPVDNLSIDNVKRLQRQDRHLRNIIAYLDTNTLPTSDRIAKSLLLSVDNFYLDDGLLYHIWIPTGRKKQELVGQLVIPEALKQDILTACHDDPMGAHFGLNKTYEKIRQRYYWSGMFQDVQHWCRSCVACSRRKLPRTAGRAPLIPLPVEGAFDRLAVDCVGPFRKTVAGNRYVVVFTDYLTKWPEAFAVPSIDAVTIARLLVDEILSRHSAPRTLLSDRGTNFLSTLVAEVCRLMSTKKSNTTSYHPQTNGLCERLNGTLIQSLSMYTSTDQLDWDVYLPQVLFAYRVSPHESTGDSPFFLLYGREPRLPLDASLLPAKDMSTSVAEHRERIVKKLEVAQKVAHENIQRVQQKMKARYDQHAKPVKYRPVIVSGCLHHSRRKDFPKS